MYFYGDFRQNKTRNIKFSLPPVVYVTVEYSEESVFTEQPKVKNNMIIWIAERLYMV